MASVPLLGVLSRLARTTSISVGERHSLLRSVKRLENGVSTEALGVVVDDASVLNAFLHFNDDVATTLPIEQYCAGKPPADGG